MSSFTSFSIFFVRFHNNLTDFICSIFKALNSHRIIWTKLFYCTSSCISDVMNLGRLQKTSSTVMLELYQTLSSTAKTIVSKCANLITIMKDNSLMFSPRVIFKSLKFDYHMPYSATSSTVMFSLSKMSSSIV